MQSLRLIPGNREHTVQHHLQALHVDIVARLRLLARMHCDPQTVTSTTAALDFGGDVYHFDGELAEEGTGILQDERTFPVQGEHHRLVSQDGRPEMKSIDRFHLAISKKLDSQEKKTVENHMAYWDGIKSARVTYLNGENISLV